MTGNDITPEQATRCATRVTPAMLRLMKLPCSDIAFHVGHPDEEEGLHIFLESVTIAPAPRVRSIPWI